MIQNATGLILRTLPLTETSLIVRWLTPEFGRISTVARGARRPQSAFHGKLDLFYEADLNCCADFSTPSAGKNRRRNWFLPLNSNCCGSLAWIPAREKRI